MINDALFHNSRSFKPILKCTFLQNVHIDNTFNYKSLLWHKTDEESLQSIKRKYARSGGSQDPQLLPYMSGTPQNCDIRTKTEIIVRHTSIYGNILLENVRNRPLNGFPCPDKTWHRLIYKKFVSGIGPDINSNNCPPQESAQLRHHPDQLSLSDILPKRCINKTKTCFTTYALYGRSR